MKASNVIGTVESVAFSNVLAATPDKPTTVPTLNLEFTTAN
jgi:hypothetical protein